MNIDKYEKIGVDKYRIYLDNGEVIDTFDNVILDNDLLLKKKLTSMEYAKILADTNLEGYYQACLKYISIRIRSEKEINDYLSKKGVTEEDKEVVINKLKKNKKIDDNYFCECFIKDKLKFTTKGEYQIINELRLHNISNEIIESNRCLMAYDIMYDKLEKLMDKKIRSSSIHDKYKLRDKLYKYFLNLGYSSSLIVEILNDKF